MQVRFVAYRIPSARASNSNVLYVFAASFDLVVYRGNFRAIMANVFFYPFFRPSPPDPQVAYPRVFHAENGRKVSR